MSKSSGGGIRGNHTFSLFDECCSLGNLFSAWAEFKRGKETKSDVQRFAYALEDNLFDLQRSLQEGRYRHGDYQAFYLQDPKLRHIHKASVRDRIVHHAVARILDRIFDRSFIYDSYSSRKDKGTHRAVRRLRELAWQLSQNNTQRVWFLKWDIRKFFDSVDHDQLLERLESRISDQPFLALNRAIITSFATNRGKGIPLGNLTSQIYSNIYLNPLDQYMKRTLGVKVYIRYADDCIVTSRDLSYLEDLLPKVRQFLDSTLLLEIHPRKVLIRKWHQGIDFLGYVLFPHHTILRPKTKRRLLKKLKMKKQQFGACQITTETFKQTAQSYLGLLHHCRGRGIERSIKTICET